MEKARRRVIRDIDIREQVIGAGSPVLMLHGWGANGDLLLPLAHELAGLGYRLLLPDLPGFGESDEPALPFSIFDYADFCLAYMDQHEIQRAHVFGHSLGGRIGLILASDYSARIGSMVLSNSAGVKARVSRVQRLRLGVYKAIRSSLEQVGMGDTAAKLRHAYNRRYASADYLDASPVMRQTLVKIVKQDLLPYARRVAAPTVLVWGDADTETPLWMGELLEGAIPDAALITHPGAGHYAYLERPRETAAIAHALFGESHKRD